MRSTHCCCSDHKLTRARASILGRVIHSTSKRTQPPPGRARPRSQGVDHTHTASTSEPTMDRQTQKLCPGYRKSIFFCRIFLTQSFVPQLGEEGHCQSQFRLWFRYDFLHTSPQEQKQSRGKLRFLQIQSISHLPQNQKSLSVLYQRPVRCNFTGEKKKKTLPHHLCPRGLVMMSLSLKRK